MTLHRTRSRADQHRTLVVQIEDIAIEDGEITPPRRGEVIEFPLLFVERPASEADTVTIRALLEASSRDPNFSTPATIRLAGGNGTECCAVTVGRRHGEAFGHAAETSNW